MMTILVESPQFKTFYAPSRSSSASSTQAYILSITSLQSYYAASSSAPHNVIDLYDKSTLQLVDTFLAHEIAITSVRTTQGVGGPLGNALVSSGKDGFVKFWDLRSTPRSPSIQLTNNRSLLCCDVSPDSLTVAAGAELHAEDAPILYWDIRCAGQILRIQESTHSDDVTCVKFAHEGLGMPQSTLLSASLDGLISASNADEDDEDDAILHVANWGCSIAQAGWVNAPSGPSVWAASDMETFGTWTKELEQRQSLDIRGPALHGQRTWVTDYLITCVADVFTPSRLGIFVGSNEGDVALISSIDQSATWQLHNVWSNGHVGVVRSILWDEKKNIFLTGGEDSKLSAWPNLPESIDVDMPSRKSVDTEGEQAKKKTQQ